MENSRSTTALTEGSWSLQGTLSRVKQKKRQTERNGLSL